MYLTCDLSLHFQKEMSLRDYNQCTWLIVVFASAILLEKSLTLTFSVNMISQLQQFCFLADLMAFLNWNSYRNQNPRHLEFLGGKVSSSLEMPAEYLPYVNLV